MRFLIHGRHARFFGQNFDQIFDQIFCQVFDQGFWDYSVQVYRDEENEVSQLLNMPTYVTLSLTLTLYYTALSHPTLPYPILSYPILSYPILSIYLSIYVSIDIPSVALITGH